MRGQRLMAWLAGLSLVFALASCQKQPPLPQQRFEVKGKVVMVNKNDGTVTLAHEAIPGYMAAMTMAYPLKDKWAFDVLKPGQSIHATLVVATEHAWLEGIVITEEAKPESTSLVPPQALRPPQVGAAVPDFHLFNQDGKTIDLHQYHGKVLLLTFIYTRCPLPDYCPLMSKNFAKIRDKLRGDNSQGISTHLLSISLDPDYDTPSVLHAYGLECVGKSASDPFKDWEFACGTPEEVRKLAEFFGLSYWNDHGQIVHALVTALIGPDGKVLKIYPGNGWQPSDVLSDLRNLKGAIG
jgi:protein SCO1